MLVRGREVVEDILEVEADVAAPVRHGLGVEDFERLEAELAHPVGLVLDVGDLMDDFGIEAFVGLEDGFGFGAEIVLVDFGRNGGVERRLRWTYLFSFRSFLLRFVSQPQ